MKKGWLSLCAFAIKSSVLLVISSSMVSMRFMVSGPVSTHDCLPQGPKRGSGGAVLTVAVAEQRNTPRGPNLSLNCGFFG